MRTLGWRFVVVALLLLVPGWVQAAGFKLKLPTGLQEDAAQIPDDNPLTVEKIMKPLGLTAQERADLVEFMKALTGEIDPAVSRPPVLPK